MVEALLVSNYRAYETYEQVIVSLPETEASDGDSDSGSEPSENIEAANREDGHDEAVGVRTGRR